MRFLRAAVLTPAILSKAAAVGAGTYPWVEASRMSRLTALIMRLIVLGPRLSLGRGGFSTGPG